MNVKIPLKKTPPFSCVKVLVFVLVLLTIVFQLRIQPQQEGSQQPYVSKDHRIQEKEKQQNWRDPLSSTPLVHLPSLARPFIFFHIAKVTFCVILSKIFSIAFFL